MDMIRHDHILIQKHALIVIWDFFQIGAAKAAPIRGVEYIVSDSTQNRHTLSGADRHKIHPILGIIISFESGMFALGNIHARTSFLSAAEGPAALRMRQGG